MLACVEKIRGPGDEDINRVCLFIELVLYSVFILYMLQTCSYLLYVCLMCNTEKLEWAWG